MRALASALLLLLLAVPLHALERQPAADYRARRTALAKELPGGVALFFANYEPELEYQEWRQDEDFYYLTGSNEPGGVLLIESALPATATEAAQPYRETLFLPTRNLRMEQYTGEKLGADTPGAAATLGVDNVAPIAALPGELNRAISANRRRPLVYPTSSLPAQNILGAVAASFGVAKLNNPTADAAGFTTPLRVHKDAGELALLHKVADASVEAQLAMMRATHPGQGERTLEGIIYASLLAHGCERPSYPSIVGSGVHSTELHYSDDSDTLRAGDVMVVDAAGEYSMYASDITRTVPVDGHFTPRQREIYNIVLGAQAAAMQSFVLGKSHVNDPAHKYPDSLDNVAFNYMNEHGKDLHGAPLGKYFIHGIGHSVGIDVHDPADYTQPIQPGEVFTIEPGIYIPEEHLGVRIEDVFYANPNGKLECLTCAVPKDAAEVERIVQGKTTPAR